MFMQKKLLILFLIMISFSLNIFSEEIINTTSDSQDENINIIKKENENAYKPTVANHITAFGEALGSNLILMGINRFIRKAPYAYITGDSIYKNLTNPWVWDQDEFTVNHLGHPYQGSFYYIAGRSNNLPFWESFLTAIAGSITWELFAETETPSYNDLIVTTIGGFAFGEMLHRLYFDAKDINSLFSFIVSPMDSINNILWDGKVNRPNGKVTSLTTKFTLGLITDNMFFTESNFEVGKRYIPLYLGGNINIVYGNPYGLETKIPYEHFDMDVKFSGAKNYYNLSLFTDGLLWSFSPWEKDNLKTTMGISMHYDFLYSTAMNYSSNAIGFTTKQNIILPHNWDIKWDLHLNYVLMSASDFFYLFKGVIDPETQLENRLYDLGIGAGGKLTLAVSHPLVGSLFASYFINWVNTIKNSLPQKGSHGYAVIGIGSVSYEHQIYKSLSLGFEYSSYMKDAFYENIEDTYEYNHFINIYLKNKF